MYAVLTFCLVGLHCYRMIIHQQTYRVGKHKYKANDSFVQHCGNCTTETLRLKAFYLTAFKNAVIAKVMSSRMRTFRAHWT